MSYQVIFTDTLCHHGVKGQRWGVRRYQNIDGSYKSGAQGRYNDDGSPGVNKSRSKKSNKSKYVKTAAIVAGTAAVTAAIIYAKKSGALDRGKDFIKNRIKGEDAKKSVSQLKTKSPDTIKELERLGIQPFKYEKFEPERIQVPRVEVPRVEVPKAQVSQKSTAKKLSDFEFNRLARVDASGKVSYVDAPKDKAGYAKSFAQQMAKGQTSGKDYDYWLKYMESKLRTM